MGIFKKGQETTWRNSNVASTVRAYVESNPGKSIKEIASGCGLLPEQVEWAVQTLRLLIYKQDKHPAYCKIMGLADTDAHKIEESPKYLKFGILFVEAQNCNLGDAIGQNFLVEADSPCDMSKAMPLVDIDLSSLYAKATVSGTVLHILGTLQ